MSSESKVEVVRLGPVNHLDGSDHLSITLVHGGYPCIVRTGAFAEGDRVAYVPVDMLVPTYQPAFVFLVDKARSDGFYRTKAMRLRGTFSMGLIVPTPDGAAVGDDVTEALGCFKWEPAVATGTDNERDPGHMPVYTDVEGFRRWQHEPGVLVPGEEWVVTEKIHGANARFCWRDGRLWVGSRTNIKREDPTSIWWQAARHHNIAEKLAGKDDIVVYGEVYGQVQDLRYGVPSGCRFVAFDVFHRPRGVFLGPLESDWSAIFDIPTVTQLGVIRPADMAPADLWALAEGPSLRPGANHIREGIVFRPRQERWHPKLGRVILKLVGEGYLTRKERH